MSATVSAPRISRKRRLALLAATTGLAAGGALIPASAFAATPAHAAHAPATAFHGPHGHGFSTTRTTTTETTTKNRHGTTTTKITETTTTTKTRRGTTSTKTTTTETTTKGHKFHQHHQDIADDGPVNGQ
ncbi:hypothetical protein [Streptomyces collinus]|uniref:hypothetical protein n=1 Tax=Streptomyces collinus TaxID=42684 RepID=UPI002941DEFE|nr:hypothetical protein [Streptomyces collinus]